MKFPYIDGELYIDGKLVATTEDVIHDDFAKILLENIKNGFEPYQESVIPIFIISKKEEENRKEDQDCRALTRDEKHNQYRKHVLMMTGGRRRYNGRNGSNKR